MSRLLESLSGNALYVSLWLVNHPVLVCYAFLATLLLLLFIMAH